MRMESTQTEVVRSENFESMKFGIQDIKTIMHIMRNKMYTNPIRTMLQEIMTNARDANLEAGVDYPITVTLPTTDNPVVSIADHGLGMSKDLIRNIYVNYGSSTKRDSDLQTGGYGLGAKSPFAYQDMFHITTIVKENEGNVQYKYCAFIGADGIGDLNLIESEATTNNTGTTISIPVDFGDIDKISDYVLELPKYWTIKPIVNHETGICKIQSVQEPTNTIDNVWFYEKNTYSSPSHGLLVDKIHYSINLNRLFSGETQETITDKYEIPENVSERLKYIFTNSYQNMLFDYKNGEIELSPNREEILYNDKNKRMIFWNMVNILEKINSDIQKEVDGCPNYLQACILFYNTKRYHKMSWLFQKEFSYKNEKLKKKIPCKTTMDVKATRYTLKYGNEYDREQLEYLSYDDTILINREPSKRFLSQLSEIKDNHDSFVIIKRLNPIKTGPVDPNVPLQVRMYTFDNWMTEYGFWLNEIGYQYLDEVVVSEKEREKTTRRLPTLDTFNWKTCIFDVDMNIESENPIYVRKCNDKYLFMGKEIDKNHFYHIAKFFSKRFKENIVILKKSLSKKYDTSKWRLLDDMIIPECEKIVNSKYFNFHVANAERNMNVLSQITNPHVYKNDPIMQKIFLLNEMKYNGRKIGIILNIFKAVDFKYEIDKDDKIDIMRYVMDRYPHILGGNYILKHYNQIRQGRVIPRTNFFQNKNIKRRRHYV